MGKYPYASTSDHTELQWLNDGYVIKRGRKGVEKYTSGTSQHTAIYYGESDVRKDEEKAAAILEKRHQAKLLQQRKARAAEKKYHDTIKKEWQKYLRKVKKIVVFDTETSGLNAGTHVILSLSWQVLDNKLCKISEKTYYFDWPDDERRITDEAIYVNGLTRERLSELGTSDKKQALQEFADVIIDADLLVAHNGGFDARFIKADAIEAGVDISFQGKELWDTMHRMTYYCKIPRGWHEYKWPRLSELADKLKIRQDDIDYHQSAADVEVTARCFRVIVCRGIVL
ncbi:MAG: 3'-5' exonuclease [Bacteroidaceae bacterium]|nr:3'-5' exonuclease [Bacteroidaceae bacterium]